jgi:hypothetical protein
VVAGAPFDSGCTKPSNGAFFNGTLRVRQDVRLSGAPYNYSNVPQQSTMSTVFLLIQQLSNEYPTVQRVEY